MTTRLLKTNFSNSELMCRCGCGTFPKDEAVIALQNLREKLVFPLEVSSAARCERHNESIGGATNSQHVKLVAFDIKCRDANRKALIAKNAFECGFRGIGVYQDFIHIDLRKEFSMWRGKY